MDGAGIRSLLFVPGDNQKLVDKALSSTADAVILDLEDSVAPDAKPAARTSVYAALADSACSRLPVFVRINALDTRWALDDLAQVMRGAPWGIVLPKCSSARDIEQLSHYLDALEAREGLVAGATRILGIVTETAASTLNLAALHQRPAARLWGVMWGSEDLAASLGARANRNDQGVYTFPYQAARSQCLYAASALHIVAIDAVWTDFRDHEGLEAETQEGLRDGFAAKAAIHPAQVDVINRVLTPEQEQVEWAVKVVAALEGKGVAKLDGRMIDLVHKRIAERVLNRRKAIAAITATKA